MKLTVGLKVYESTLPVELNDLSGQIRVRATATSPSMTWGKTIDEAIAAGWFQCVYEPPKRKGFPRACCVEYLELLERLGTRRFLHPNDELLRDLESFVEAEYRAHVDAAAEAD